MDESYSYPRLLYKKGAIWFYKLVVLKARSRAKVMSKSQDRQAAGS